MISKQLTLRALLLSVLGSILITASSTYVALRMSALPWPTVFVAILSMALIKLRGCGNINEINIAQTGMSAGAMVAGGIVFTLPGLWITGIFKPFNPATQTFREWMLPKFFPVLFVALAGTVAGTAVCYIIRKQFIEKENLPFPIAAAATETLRAGDSGGKKSIILITAMTGAGIFTLLRDQIKIANRNIIPQGFAYRLKSFPLELTASPMAVGIGYIIGFTPCAWWLAGGIFSHFVLQTWAVKLENFASVSDAASFTLTTAIGLMVGSGIAILINFSKRLCNLKTQTVKTSNENTGIANTPNKKIRTIILITSAGIVFLFSNLAKIPAIPSALLLLGIAFASIMSASITGQTGINPMEIFAILVLLAIRIFTKIEPLHAFFITGITAVTCGFAGDMLNDYKMGFNLGTDHTAQTVSQFIGATVGSIVATLAMFAIIANYGGIGNGTGLTAAQAHTVASMIQGIGSPLIFTIATLLGTIFFLKKIPAMIIGIGMILPLGMSTAIFIGGIVSLLAKHFSKKTDYNITGQIISAGLLGGEGFVGTIIAIIQMFLK
ncbi:MAG: peptide transporter [Treponema sp.]|nr:MAG: peptide transporter [Treponema sp.]